MINPVLRRPLLNVAQRHMQTSSTVSTTFLTKNAEFSAKKVWFSDPSTYPLFVVMGTAVCLVAGVAYSFLVTCPDVQISTKKRNQILRTWGLPGYQHPG